MKNERDFKGIWIEKDVWLNKGLTLNEKVFLSEIDSLDNKDGCFASNEYFSEFFGLSERACISTITSLVKKGLVIRESFDGRKRVLRSAMKKASPLPGSSLHPGHEENFMSSIYNKEENKEDISERDFSFHSVNDKAESKKEYMARKGLPYTPRAQTEAQKKAFSKSIEIQPVIDYFKEVGQQVHGMYFLQGSETRNKQVLGQIKNVSGMITDHKALIDWWFKTDNAWCNYEPEALFKEKIIERFVNKDKTENAEIQSKKPLLEVGGLKFYTQEEITNARNAGAIGWSDAGRCWKKTQ